MRHGIKLADGAFLGSVGYVASSTGTPLHSTATGWKTRATANGGSPTDATVSALSTFCYALDAASITSKMLALNAYVADDLICCTTPLIVGVGSDPWTNINFAGGDLSIHGLSGGSGNEYLQTGVVASTSFASNAKGGITLYVTVNGNVAGIEAGCNGEADTDTFMLANYSGTTYWDCVGQGTGRISQANSGWTGYLSGNRTASNSTVIYRAKSSTPHEVLKSDTTSADSAYAAREVYFHANNGKGVAILFSSNRLSFGAIHDGLTQSESSAFYAAVQALRTTLGGGYV